MVYLGETYLHPVVNRTVFLDAFQNSYGRKADKPKIVLKGLNLLDACLDLKGEILLGKTTLLITAKSKTDLKVLVAILNSPLAMFYIKQRYPAASYNQGTTFTKDMLNDLPVRVLSQEQRADLVDLVDKVLTEKEEGPTDDSALTERLDC